ncbi:MAG TPA: DUF4189 domain-containing protein [Mycobacterium sp.]|nr:DUF4189 domain-containing protein [Mycobacterium sp.]
MMQRKRVGQVLALVSAVTACGALSAVTSPPATAAGPYAVIAWSAPEGVSGTGEGATFDEAVEKAKASCQSNGGTVCQQAVTTEVACIALAVDGAKFTGGRGPTLNAARSDALARNGGGTVKQAMCSAATAAAPAPPPPPTAKDTDLDGLSDRDEVTIQFTNPLLPDTDLDGVNDGTEVKNGTNPLVVFSN